MEVNESLRVQCEKSYIEINNGNLIIGPMTTPNLHFQNSVWNEPLVDKIENFSLKYFKIHLKREISFFILHKRSGLNRMIAIWANKEDVEKYIQFRDIMDRHGVFENRSRMDLLYGKDSAYQKGVDEMREKKEKEQREQRDFYNELKSLPGYDAGGTQKEIKYLQKIIHQDEKVLAIASGVMDANTWLIACTSKRIIFIDCGMVYGVKHSEVMIDKVHAVSFKNGMVLGEIYVEDGARSRVIKNVLKSSTEPFVNAVHRAMEMRRDTNMTMNIPQQPTSPADELLKYKNLLDIGAITQEEYEQQKRKLLDH